ncbi:MOSC domain-containing protein [Rhodobacteraceae bacterium N5(2021)]|uniref:MOSC domain-containing protein n=1 Tax=Gymnodinialimonas phycosphaerae TaxID=2841589 RepID=A0A975TUG5_9RHOB|nr:MOSC domain-containing protein [Gymnodinialimonas phycosphaerae]MBY4894416.1 MOSC domain-containing protein [Gymnodinialimonas phycosphaerae]
METLATLTARHAQTGRLDWIGLRPKRLAGLQPVPEASLQADGLQGDHARPGKRALTLIQAEHLPVIAALAGLPDLAPEVLRRNLVISRLNLQALRGKQIRIGEALIEITIPCAPCSRMEAALGPGGYTAMRGHGGWCAQVLEPGQLSIGCPVTPA